LTDLKALGAVVWRLGFRRGTAWYFWRTVFSLLATRRENLETALHLMALFLHFRKHTQFVIEQHLARIPQSEREPMRHAAGVGVSH
jgi:hypothetical protein